jgi:hypothetical protein
LGDTYINPTSYFVLIYQTVNMKKTVLFLFLSFLTTLAFSQTKTDTAKVKKMTLEERCLRLTNNITRRVNLTTEQQPKVYAVNEWYFRSLDSLQKDTISPKPARIAKSHQLEDERDARYKTIFTPEQQKIFFTKEHD